MAQGVVAKNHERIARRKHLIKCCGKSSCLNVKPKKKPQHESKNISTKMTLAIRSTTSAVHGKNHTILTQIAYTSGPVVDFVSTEGSSTNPTEEATSDMETETSEIVPPSDQTVSTSTLSLVPTSTAEALASTSTQRGSSMHLVLSEVTTVSTSKGTSDGLKFPSSSFSSISSSKNLDASTSSIISTTSTTTSTSTTKTPSTVSASNETTVSTHTEAYSTLSTKAAQVIMKNKHHDYLNYSC